MTDQIFYQIRFKIEKDGYSLSDALIIPKTEYESMKPEDIEALKKERINNHIDRIKNPVSFPEPTIEQKLEAITAQFAEVKSQKEQIEAEALTPEQKLAEIDKQLTELSEKRAEVEKVVPVKPKTDATVSFHKGGK